MTSQLVPQVTEEEISVTLNSFLPVTPVQDEPINKRVRRKIVFDDNVPDHLKQAYCLKEYLEHHYDERGNDTLKKRFNGKLSVSIKGVTKEQNTGSITFTEKRKGLFSKKIVKTYEFSNQVEYNEFMTCFGIDVISSNFLTLSGVQIAGGSIIKAIIRGDNYVDKYFDRIEQKPKLVISAALVKIATMSASAIIATLVTILL